MGKLKVGWTDAVFLILILGILGFLLVINPDPHSFSGAEVYYAISKYKALDARGFDLEVQVNGKEVSTGEDISITGAVSRIKSGMLTVDTGERKYSVGGILAGVEDIAATEILILVKTPTVVQVRHAPMNFNSLDDFCMEMYSFADDVAFSYNVEGVKLEGQIGVNANLGPAKQVDIVNMLSLEEDEELFLYTNGFRLDSNSINLNELCALGISTWQGSSTDLLVKIALNSKVSESEALKIKERLPDAAFKDSFRVVSED